MKGMTLRDALIDELKNIRSVENQVLKILPEVMKRVSSERLRDNLQGHVKRLENQVTRLDEVLAILGQTQQGRRATAIDRLCDESNALFKSAAEPRVFDAALVALCHKAEHYGIATYGCMIAWAEGLRLNEIGYLLRETLAEKEDAKTALRKFAEVEFRADAADAGGWTAVQDAPTLGALRTKPKLAEPALSIPREALRVTVLGGQPTV